MAINKEAPITNSVSVAGTAEAAEIVNVSKSNLSAHRDKFSGEGQFPRPTVILASGPVWAGRDYTALQRWAKEFAKVRQTRTRAENPAAAKKAAKKVASAAVKAPPKKAPTAKAAKPVAKKAAAKKGGFLGGKTAA